MIVIIARFLLCAFLEFWKLQGTFGKVDFFVASGAALFFIKLIGKELPFLSAIRTLANKRVEIVVLIKTGTGFRCIHKNLL